MKTRLNTSPSKFDGIVDYREFSIDTEVWLDFEIVPTTSSHPDQNILSQQWNETTLIRQHDCPSQLLVDDYYQYFNVTSYYSSYWVITSQIVLLTGLSYFLPDHLTILYVFGLDNLVNLLTYINQMYCSHIKCFYREWWTLKYLLLLLVSPIGLILSLTGSTMIVKLFWISVNLPIVINYLANVNWVRQWYYHGFQYVYAIMQFLFCQKIAKIINRTSEKYLYQNPRLSASELVKLISFSNNQNQLIKFSSSSILAFILFYLELDGTKFYTILARQFYFREYFFQKSPNQVEHRQYILDLIVRRQWQKFSDIYTLNRLLKLYLEINSEQNGGLFWTNYSSGLSHACNRLFATMALGVFLPTYSNLNSIFYLIDSTIRLKATIRNNSPKKSRCYQIYVLQLFIIALSMGINHFTQEFMLRMIGLECAYVLMGNTIFLKLCLDIINICRFHLQCVSQFTRINQLK